MPKQSMLSPAARERLRYVRVDPGPVDLGRFPDFLVIGPQRTGTTWLHENLRDHPDIFWPRLKEIFFFSRLKQPDHPKFRSNQLSWYLDQFHDAPWMWAIKTFFCLRASGRLYRPRVFGEATASYAAMDRDLIEEVVALNPDVRAIMMVRNPVERAWSHAKKDLVRNRGRAFSDVGDEEWREFFSDPYQRRCAQYAENFDNWSACLKPGHLMLGRFDDIGSRPEQLLLEVMRFLGVDADPRYLGRAVREAVNPTAGEAVPEKHRLFLEQLLGEDIENLAARFEMRWD
jgi:hypothetical protein